MKVSVLMPIYNTNENYLRQAIESILNQTFQDFEFLIYDDNSTIDLESIVESYNDKRIIYKKMAKNLGISSIRNILVEDAQGEYLAIMDHDDIRLPKSFEKEVEILDNNQNIGVVGSWHGFVHHNKIFKRPIKDKEIKKTMFYECPIHHPTTMIRKSVFIDNNIRYDEKYTPAEDYFLWATLLDKTDFYNIPEVLFLYRDDYKNTTNLQKEKITEAIYNVLKYLKQKYPKIYEQVHVEMKLKKHIKNFFLPFEYILEPFAILRYAIKLFKLKTTDKLKAEAK